MKKFLSLIKFCDCSKDYSNSLSKSQSISYIVNDPICLNFVQPKSIQDEEDLSPDSTFDTGSSKKESIEFSSKPKCFECNETQNISQLKCKHHICSTCTDAKLRKFLSSDKKGTLKCVCEEPITINYIEKIAKIEILIRFLNETGITGVENQNCSICGFVHTGTCLEHYRENVNTDKNCMICKENEKFLLNCGHSYCASCLKTHAQDTLKANPLGIVSCKDCETHSSIIPAWILNEIFGNPEDYIVFQSLSKHKKRTSTHNFCMICLKRLNSKFIKLECGDKYCKKCISAYFENTIFQFTKDCNISCPHCESKIDPLIIQGNISSEACEIFLEMLIKENKHKKHLNSKISWCVHSKYTKGETGNCYKCMQFPQVHTNTEPSRMKIRKVISILNLDDDDDDERIIF